MIMSVASGWLVPSPLRAQGQTDTRAVVMGQVRLASGRPIAGAEIRVDGDSTITMADDLGRFRLRSARGARILRARALGYQPVDTLVDVSGDRVPVGIVMARLPARLDSVRVTATGTGMPRRLDTFHEHRRAAIGGTFFTREDVDAADALDLYALLARAPGVRVQRSGSGGEELRFERCAGSATGGRSGAVQLFIDGTRVGSPLTTLEAMKPSEVEAIEIYQGAAQLPMEARGDGCAAIFIWTRDRAGAAERDR